MSEKKKEKLILTLENVLLFLKPIPKATETKRKKWVERLFIFSFITAIKKIFPIQGSQKWPLLKFLNNICTFLATNSLFFLR